MPYLCFLKVPVKNIVKSETRKNRRQRRASPRRRSPVRKIKPKRKRIRGRYARQRSRSR